MNAAMLKKLLGPGGLQRKRGGMSSAGNVAGRAQKDIEGLVGKEIQKAVKALGSGAKRSAPKRRAGTGRASGTGRARAGMSSAGNVGQFALKELKKLGLAGLDSGVPQDVYKAAKKALGGKRGGAVVGSKLQVFSGTADKTSGGLKKSDLMKNKRGKVVSKKQHESGKEALKNLKRSGYA